MPKRRLLIALVAWWVLPALGADTPPVPCRIDGLKNEVLCGRVERALDPAQPQARQIDVHYVVVPATARHKAPDPVFFLAGGPGQSAISLAASVVPLLSRLGNRRDLVFVDQRGTGRSAPLACDDDERRPLAERIDAQRMIERLRACRERLSAQPHGDLRQVHRKLGVPARPLRPRLGLLPDCHRTDQLSQHRRGSPPLAVEQPPQVRQKRLDRLPSQRPRRRGRPAPWSPGPLHPNRGPGPARR